MLLFIDTQAGGNKIKEQIQSLKLIPGTCIFIDMCNSTELKQNSLPEWVTKISNTINLVGKTSSLFENHIVKLIGDEIMFYIPDSNLGEENHATLFGEVKYALANFNNKIDDITLRLKAAIHYCHKDVYNFTFIKECNDYYGIDIDLTSRLMEKAVEKRIVLSNEFYKKVKDPTIMNGVSRVYIEDFKGISSPTEFRIYQVPWMKFA